MGLTAASILKDENEELTWQGVPNLQYYKENFEEEFIKQTHEFYIIETSKWIHQLSCPEYVRTSLECLKKEEEKVTNFLDKETRPKLIEKLNDTIAGKYAEKLCDMDKTGVVEMLKNKRVEELKQLTTLLGRKPDTLKFISDKLKPYIIERGNSLKDNKEIKDDPNAYISKLIELKKEMDTMMTEAFYGIEQFLKVNDASFQEIMDLFDPAPRYLAEYNDNLMTVGLRGKETEAESMIESVFGLFKLLKSKDIFTERNKELYAMRLLQHTSISDQAEDSLIAKLKVELGAQHVAKYIQMNVDMKNSRESTENFKKRDHKGLIKGVELTVKVLTSGLWGSEQNTLCKIPEELNECSKKFEEFYKLEHIGRHLVWNAAIGDCEMKSLYLSKPYTFIVNVYQASILMRFNENQNYTFSQLANLTNLPHDVLKKQLLNITNPRLGKLLIKANLKTPNFDPNEDIKINNEFSSSGLRVRLIPITKKVNHLNSFTIIAN